MKNLVFVLVSILTIGFFTSCDKDVNDVASNEVLIEEIANSSAKQNIEPADLPATTKEFIEEEHFETFVESAAYVDGKGYEVTLATEDVEYFNNTGSVLRSNSRPHQCHRPGPCGGGQRIRIQDLPAGIVAYINNNYPDAEIKRAKTKGIFYLVGINGPDMGPTVLVFNMNNEFILEAPLFRFCNGERINIDNLPDVITDYISDNCPDGEIKVAWRARGKVFVGILTPDGRKIYVFNLDGDFLFELP